MSEKQHVIDHLWENTEHLLLFEKTVNPILVTDEDGNYIMCNEAALQFLECTREELLSRNAKDLIPPGKEKVIDKYIQVWKKGGTIETEYYLYYQRDRAGYRPRAQYMLWYCHRT